MEKLFKQINLVFLIALIATFIVNIYVAYIVPVKTNGEIHDASTQKIEIIIDPGHGGMDPGTVGALKKPEAPINLDISLKLAKLLEGSGFTVKMTRCDDNGLYTNSLATVRDKKNEDLNKRVELINNSNANIAVSIHLNSFPQKKYYGAHVFFKKNCEESKIAATILQDEMRDILDSDNKRVPQSKTDIRIMDSSKIPIILIECGFLSNPEEESKLINNEYQEKIAWSIYSGLLKYFNQPKSN